MSMSAVVYGFKYSINLLVSAVAHDFKYIINLLVDEKRKLSENLIERDSSVELAKELGLFVFSAPPCLLMFCIFIFVKDGHKLEYSFILKFSFIVLTISILTALTVAFLAYAGHLIFRFLLLVYIPIVIMLFGFTDYYLKFRYKELACLLVLIPVLYFLPAQIKQICRTLYLDKDHQAHTLFLLSMATLACGLWLQSGGNWQQMASLTSLITIPGFDPIPFTASISFPFALLGWIENPAGSALSTVVAAQTNEILTLFAAAAVLFFFAVNRVQLSAFGLRPEFALLAFALFWVSVFFDVALHWSGAPVLSPHLIFLNRAFAVLALGVSLFWRNAAKRGEDVPGADGEYRKACDAAEGTAWKIGFWLLGLVWLATQLSHASLSPVALYWVKFVMVSVFVAIPLRLMIQFKLEFQKALGRYNQLWNLWKQSYKPPPTVATDEEVKDALSGGRGIGGAGWNDTGD